MLYEMADRGRLREWPLISTLNRFKSCGTTHINYPKGSTRKPCIFWTVHLFRQIRLPNITGSFGMKLWRSLSQWSDTCRSTTRV